MTDVQNIKFNKSWFLFWRSKEAREDLANVYKTLELLKADVDVGGLVEKKLTFLTNYRAWRKRFSRSFDKSPVPPQPMEPVK